MSKRHEEMARKAMGQLYHEDDVANVAALLARVEREALERAIERVKERAERYWLAAEEAANDIRALLEDDNA